MERDLIVLKALPDKTRLRILFLLASRELCVCELVAVLEMPQGKISRHLAILKNADLVTDRRDATWVYYSLGEPESALDARLRAYLIEDGDHKDLVSSDLRRFSELAGNGEICVPNPSPAHPGDRSVLSDANV